MISYGHLGSKKDNWIREAGGTPKFGKGGGRRAEFHKGGGRRPPSSHIRVSVNGKNEKFSFYMRSFVKKLFFDTCHVKFIGISRISPSQIN